MVKLEDINQWRGEDVVDAGGEKIGTLEEIYYDSETDQPLFLGVKVGLLSPHLTFVPFQGLSVGKEHLLTDQAKSQVKSAPTLALNAELPQEEEAKIFDHYHLDYTRGSTPTGKRLIRR
ncbi:MAG: PRC-barrel domain-containing protein [Candidatus Dormibacteraceae bacterium]